MKDGKFEVGDKVRLTQEGHEYFARYEKKGDVFVVGTLGEVVGFKCGLVTVRFDVPIEHRFNSGGDAGWCMQNDQIELVASVEPARKFAVGDRVRVVRSALWHVEAGSGAEGEVVSTDGTHHACFDYDGYPIAVRITKKATGEEYDYAFPYQASDLELIEEAIVDEPSPEAPASDESVEGVSPVIGAETDNMRFILRHGDVIDVHVAIGEDEHVSVKMTLAQFNEVHRIINEEGNV